MSSLGWIGYITAETGLKYALSLVYAENTTPHLLSVTAINRALRGN